MDGGESSEGGGNERQGKKDPSQIVFLQRGCVAGEDVPRRAASTDRQTDRQTGKTPAGAREQQRASCRISNRADCLRGWMLELSCAVQCRAERSMEEATRLDDTAVRSKDAGRSTIGLDRATQLHVLCLACQDRVPYAEPVVGGIEEGGGWSSIRSDSSRVESSRIVSRPCLVVWCVVVVCRAVILQQASRVLVWVRGKPWLEKCWCPFVIWPGSRSGPAVPRPAWLLLWSGDGGARGQTGGRGRETGDGEAWTAIGRLLERG